MSKARIPELKKYMDKKLTIKLNGNRQVAGVLRGYDAFMNIVMDDVSEIVVDNKEQRTENKFVGSTVIRGNSIVSMEALEPI